MKNNINKTLKADLCTGCGVCEGACPFDVISTIVDRGNFRPRIDNDRCTDCGRCVKTCPGIDVDLLGIASKCQPDPAHSDKMVGHYQKCFTGYSNDFDIRFHSASGGIVSQFLIWLLENDKIDGAVVTRFDSKNPLLVKTFIATTKEEIISARSSKYSPVSFNAVARDIKSAPGSRYVIIGLPCHIEGLRKLMTIDKKLRDRIVGLFGIFCSSGRSFFLTEYVFRKRGIDQSKISYFQYRDEGCLGKMVVKLPNDCKSSVRKSGDHSEIELKDNAVYYKELYQSYYHPNRSFFIPNRCNYCIDHYAELSDITFGDIHIKPYSDDTTGVNSIIVKDKRWLALLEECKRSGAITIDEIPFKTVSDSQRMSFKKKGRNGAYIHIAKRLGLSVPDFHVDYLRKPTLKDWLAFTQTRLQQFLGRHKSMWWMVSILKAKVNIH